MDKTSKATISYTRPYDYMDARDRTEILEAFFWFGQVQSNPKEFTWRPCSIPYNSCEFVYKFVNLLLAASLTLERKTSTDLDY